MIALGIEGENNLERFLEIIAVDKITTKLIPNERKKCERKKCDSVCLTKVEHLGAPKIENKYYLYKIFPDKRNLVLSSDPGEIVEMPNVLRRATRQWPSDPGRR